MEESVTSEIVKAAVAATIDGQGDAVRDEKFSGVKEQFRRQLDFYDYEKVMNTPVTIVGAGGLGSLVALMMRKSGFTKFTIYDHDSLEEHNVSNQMFSHGHLGMKKVEGLAEEVRGWMNQDVIPAEVSAIDRLVVSNTVIETPVLVVATDSLSARREILAAFLDSPDCNILLDLRMGGYNYSIHLADKADQRSMDAYKASLNGEAEPLPCTGRSLFCTGAACAAHACLQLIFHLVEGNDAGVWQLRGDLINSFNYGKIEKK